MARELNEAVWLLNAEQAVRLVDFPAVLGDWQWSEDSSLLWFWYVEREYGAGGAIVHLSDSPIVVPQEHPSLFAPTYNQIAVSPHKSALTIEDPPEFIPPTNTLYHFKLGQSLVTPTMTETVHGLLRVEWNSDTNSFLIVRAENKDSQIRLDDALKIRSDDTFHEITVPLRPFARVINNIAQEGVVNYFATATYLLSESRQRVAVISGDGEVYIYDCANG